MEMSSSSVVCREIFDENSAPSAEEISLYAQAIGIDPESESHLLPLAKDGLMQALPPPWKVYFDRKSSAYYYVNDETKVTTWEHPLDSVYRDLVRKARDSSTREDTSVQELMTYEENAKSAALAHVKHDSDDECHFSDHTDRKKGKNRYRPPNPNKFMTEGPPPLRPIPIRHASKILSELKLSPIKNLNETEFSMISKESEDLEIRDLSSPEQREFTLFSNTAQDKCLNLSDHIEMFSNMNLKELPDPGPHESLTLDLGAKCEIPKSILREKFADNATKKFVQTTKSTASLDDEKKSVRFQIANALLDPTLSPSSNSSSEPNDGSVASAPSSMNPSLMPLHNPPLLSPSVPSITTLNRIVPNYPLKLAPLPALPPVKNIKVPSQGDPSAAKDDDGDNGNLNTSPKRRLLRPPAADYIKANLFMKNFQKISDMVKPGDVGSSSTSLDVPAQSDSEIRPRSPMIPVTKSNISINLMESIDSETSLESPEKDVENLALDELEDSSNESNKQINTPEKLEDQAAANASSALLCQNSPSPRVVKKISNALVEIKSPISSKHSSRLSVASGSELNDTENKNNVTGASNEEKEISLNPEIDSPKNASQEPSCSSFPSASKPTHLKSDSSSSKSKSLASPKLDGVIISQGKSFNKYSDKVVVMFQFETPENETTDIKPVAGDVGKSVKEEEKSRLEKLLRIELDAIRADWVEEEKKIRFDLLEDIEMTRERLQEERSTKLSELADQHVLRLEEEMLEQEQIYEEKIKALSIDSEEKLDRDCSTLEGEYEDRLAQLCRDLDQKYRENRNMIELENERAIYELRKQAESNLETEKSQILEETNDILTKLREEQLTRVSDLRNDYRAEVERLRNQHACHLEELRARQASERAAAAKRNATETQQLLEKYKCLKEKYARLKRDVKMSIERRNKRREMSLTTGSETEKSNSHKANLSSLQKCKEANEITVTAKIEAETFRVKKMTNDNETSVSESAHKPIDNNNVWKEKEHDASERSVSCAKPTPGKVFGHVAFSESTKQPRDRDRDAGTMSDYQDSSDATTTADDKPKESHNGQGRRRCFTRLKSASTSRLNYSPKRSEGWSSPLESLRQQLRKLDDLEDQFPDLACQPSYSLRYPFSELGEMASADTPELEFVRHRALVEREGMRRARAILRRRRSALRERHASSSPQRPPSEERDTTELEVALHRACALLGEKEIRLRHIERALRRLAIPRDRVPLALQDVQASEASSESEGGGASGGGGGDAAVVNSAVLRSLRALHADVRDIWMAVDAKRTLTATPDSSSYNATSSQPRDSQSAAEPLMRGSVEGNISERAKGLKAWLQNYP